MKLTELEKAKLQDAFNRAYDHVSFDMLKSVVESIIASRERMAVEKTFNRVQNELYKHKFNTEMTGWEIVPKLVATMQLLEEELQQLHDGNQVDKVSEEKGE